MNKQGKRRHLSALGSRHSLGICILSMLAACAAESDELGAADGGAARDGAAAIDGGANTDADPTSPDAGDLALCEEPTNLGRGRAWVRNNPLFISGLTASMDAPTPAARDDYFGDFGATSAHVWLDGLPSKVQAWSDSGTNRFLAWTRNDGTAFNNEVIGGLTANLPGRIGFQVGDEPRNMATLLELDDGIDAIRAADPDALLFVNFTFEADDIDDLLSHYGTSMDGDIVSYDRYSRSSRAYESLALFRDAGLAHGLPYWAYLRSYRGPGEDDSSASDMRWNVYSHILYGYTGFSWFLYQWGAPGGDAAIESVSFFDTNASFLATKTVVFDLAAELNTELENLGRVVTQLQSTDVRYVADVALLQPRSTQGWDAGAGGDLYLVAVETVGNLKDAGIGFFVDDCDETYMMVQNPNHTGGSFPIDNGDASTVKLRFDFAGAPASVERSEMLAFDATSGTTYSLPLSPVGGDQHELAIALVAGHGLMLKYSTGRGFAVQP